MEDIKTESVDSMMLKFNALLDRFISFSEDRTKFLIVCKCGEHNSKNATLELNFRDQTIYYKCHKCDQIVTMILQAKEALPWPKTRLAR